MRNLLLILALSISTLSYGQSFEEYKRQAMSDFKDYKQTTEKEFEEYRQKVNAEYANLLKQQWEAHNAEPAKPLPTRPEPPKPVVKDPTITPLAEPIPFKVVKPAPRPLPTLPPAPVVPLPEPVQPEERGFAFTYYGTPCTVSLEDSNRFTLKDVSEASVADAWTRLSQDDFIDVLAESLQWRDKLSLGDWAYYRFVESLSDNFFTSAKSNEARLLQMYLLTQSGYKVRIARTGERLVLLLPFPSQIYNYSYIPINDNFYYIIDSRPAEGGYFLFDREFPKEQQFSLAIKSEPAFAVEPTASRVLQSKRYPEAKADVITNKNLVDFYNEYPISGNWELYSRSSISEVTKKNLYPALKDAIQDKSELEAANILLNFVQTAFEYQTDDVQFGRERPLFGDETIFYPYCDCEDRSILFSILIRDLLGLDVVLLNYPGHLSTAVCFEGDVAGDYFEISGKRFVACDPTYIGANVGESMPNFKGKQAEIVAI